MGALVDVLSKNWSAVRQHICTKQTVYNSLLCSQEHYDSMTSQTRVFCNSHDYTGDSALSLSLSLFWLQIFAFNYAECLSMPW